jgi:hypothetical protein
MSSACAVGPDAKSHWLDSEAAVAFARLGLVRGAAHAGRDGIP